MPADFTPMGCAYTPCSRRHRSGSKYCEFHNEHSVAAGIIEMGAVGTNPKDALGSKKPRLSLVPPASVIYEALAMENGADKYGPYNWRDKKVQALIYTEAAMRHILSWQDGEEKAKDSGVHHLAHAKACLGILIDALETGCLVDNRPSKGVAAKVIEENTKQKDS